MSEFISIHQHLDTSWSDTDVKELGDTIISVYWERSREFYLNNVINRLKMRSLRKMYKYDSLLFSQRTWGLQYIVNNNQETIWYTYILWSLKLMLQTCKIVNTILSKDPLKRIYITTNFTFHWFRLSFILWYWLSWNSIILIIT